MSWFRLPKIFDRRVSAEIRAIADRHGIVTIEPEPRPHTTPASYDRWRRDMLDLAPKK